MGLAAYGRAARLQVPELTTFDDAEYRPVVVDDPVVAGHDPADIRAPRARREPFVPFTGRTPGPSPEHLDGLEFRDFHPDEVATLLLDGRIGAIVTGRSEAGPRALCNRSIIARPAPAQLRTRLNSIKDREQWRPFGPVASATTDRRLWDDVGELSRYMLGAARMTETGLDTAPAVAHVDGTTRPQELRPGESPTISAVLDAMAAQGAAPVLVNTSFNGRGEPIVDTAADALAAFHRLDLDFLILEDRVLRKLSAP
ncbi:hypothetical protein GCM10022254_32280 [Actinomadura meridiana]|uniref:Carbamoyltransferase C-terminal domain-containing protein n=1 Tax=Actinomadura meridiana TaxID=559626 RepID=A0ABP8C2M8_9ACTN